jgi:ATP synthase protein I
MGKEEDPFYKGLSYAARIGVELVVATLMGSALGFLADRFFRTTPWLMIVGLLLGASAGFLNIFRFVQALQKKEDQEQKTDKN